MHVFYGLCTWLAILTCTTARLITYEDVRGTPYKVGYDHRAITINGVRTLLISGAVHYARSTPGMWPYIMRMAKNQGLNAIQTYVFWNMHERRQGEFDFSERANLSLFLQNAAEAGLFVYLRVGPFIGAEWNQGGLPVWLNHIANISFRSNNDVWKSFMRKYILDIMNYASPYLAKNGGPVILAQIENEYGGKDQAYVDWCGSLVTNELAFTAIPWTMCNGMSANSTIVTCNSCNCYDGGWMDHFRQNYSDRPMIFTENEGWYQQWGLASGIRQTSDLAWSVAEWFAAGGAYHSYYMWQGGNNYGHTACAGVTTIYADDVCLHSDGTPNEPKYTHLSRLQHLIAEHAEVLVSQDANRTLVPWWDGREWRDGAQSFVFSYLPSLHFIGSQLDFDTMVLFRDQNISIARKSMQIYDDNLVLLWDNANYSDIPSDITEMVPIINDSLPWKVWSESIVSDIPVITALSPQEQLLLTNDETIYLWYRRHVTLQRALPNVLITIQTHMANALLFFLNRVYLGETDNHDHGGGNIQVSVALDLSQFKPDQTYLLEILSISLGINTGMGPNYFEQKGIVGNVWLDGQLLVDNLTKTNFWQHQKGLAGEYFQIYTEGGSSKVPWDPQWTKGINKPTTWFQTRFDLDSLIKNDTNANPILLDAQGLNRGHAFVNGNDLGLYWLIEGLCQTKSLACQQAQINCLKPSQRYYHIPSDWLMAKNNLLTLFDDLGAPSPQSVRLVQRIVKK